MIMKILYIKLIYIAFLLVLFSGCKKFLEIHPPKDQISGSSVFDDEQSANAAITGIYTSMMQFPKFANSYATINCGLAADELESSDPGNQFFANSLRPENTAINDIWSQAYSYIYSANTCISGLESSQKISLITKNQLLAEAKFIRAYNYFYLLNIFGEVPLIISPDYISNSKKSRTSKDSIVNQIINDLSEAKAMLPEDYIAPLKVRPNKWTASALLAKVYLYNQLWDKGESESSGIILSGRYQMENDLTKVFLKESKETIWQLMPVDIRYNTMEGSLLLPYAMMYSPAWPITSLLVNSFEDTDMRKKFWLDSILYQGKVYYYPSKYKLSTASTPMKEYYVIFRLAEIYLIRAECSLHLNMLADAKNDINTIRSRAGLSEITVVDTLMNNVMRERQLELAYELGNRWCDLKRTNQIDDVLTRAKPATWKPYMKVWPIPQTQILANPFLSQNEGYR